jgi:hypothetical protein
MDKVQKTAFTHYNADFIHYFIIQTVVGAVASGSVLDSPHCCRSGSQTSLCELTDSFLVYVTAPFHLCSLYGVEFKVS